jgi:hypothetical protein
MWLIGRLMPDFKTIADFRRDSGPTIRAACAQFVVLCRQFNLFTRTIVAIDGSHRRHLRRPLAKRGRSVAPLFRPFVLSKLSLEAGMANSPSSDPQQSGSDRQATVLIVDDDPALQTMILDYFVDNTSRRCRRLVATRWSASLARTKSTS